MYKNKIAEIKKNMIVDNPEEVPELNTFHMKLARELLRARIYKGVDKKDMANNIKVSIAKINRIECGNFCVKSFDVINNYLNELGFEFEINLITDK